METKIKVDGRGILHVGRKFDSLEGGSKTAPASALGSTDPGPNPESPIEEVGAIRNYSNRNAGRAEIAAEFLRIAARDLATATRARIRYIGLARQYGVTNAAIADALGVTEKAVRGLIERNADCIGEE